MPEVYVHVVKGRTFEQKKALVQDITSAVMKHMNAPADAVVVTIIEAEADSKGKGGVMGRASKTRQCSALRCSPRPQAGSGR